MGEGGGSKIPEITNNRRGLKCICVLYLSSCLGVEKRKPFYFYKTPLPNTYRTPLSIKHQDTLLYMYVVRICKTSPCSNSIATVLTRSFYRKHTLCINTTVQSDHLLIECEGPYHYNKDKEIAKYLPIVFCSNSSPMFSSNLTELSGLSF